MADEAVSVMVFSTYTGLPACMLVKYMLRAMQAAWQYKWHLHWGRLLTFGTAIPGRTPCRCIIFCFGCIAAHNGTSFELGTLLNAGPLFDFCYIPTPIMPSLYFACHKGAF